MIVKYKDILDIEFKKEGINQKFTIKELLKLEQQIEYIYGNITEIFLINLFLNNIELLCKLIKIEYKDYLKRF